MDTAYFVAELSEFAVIAIEIKFWCTIGRTMAVIRDVAGLASDDVFDLCIIAMLEVRD